MSVRNIVGDPTWLFDLGFPIQRFDVTTSKTGLLDDLSWSLSKRYALPALARLSDPHNVDVEYRCAWHERGLMLEVDLGLSPEIGSEGKPRRRNDIESSSLHSLTCQLDTRGSVGIHRANQYCHRFVFDHVGTIASSKVITKDGDCRPIPRAIANPPDVKRDYLPFEIQMTENKRALWRVFLNASGLHGFDPIEFPDIGLHLIVYWPGLGTLNLARSLLAPVHEDPSLWCRAKFV